ncbi:putative yir3 protein, partial [Plasmodium yoelii yoelii]
CKNFYAINNSIPHNLENKGNYKFVMNENILNGYCTSNNCSSNHEKINAGCLYLFDAFFQSSSVFDSVAKGNINVYEYIMIWLSKMLNRIDNKEKQSLTFFYDIYIKNENYKKPISSFTKYKDYKELIDETNMMKMDIKDISKLYDAFTTLCMMYIEFDEKSPDCNKCSKYADEFVKKYNKLNNDSDIAKDSPYYRLLSTLSNDYDNFKKYCNSKGGKCEKYPSLTSIENMQTPAHSYGQISEDTSSSSSITTRLFTGFRV